MANKKENYKNIGNCPLCGRVMYEGCNLDAHHLIPKTFKGKETILIHRICHQKIHSIFTERELLNEYYTIENLLSHEDIKSFVHWVQKIDPMIYKRNKTSNRKKEKKRR